jgi:hypothetical protein
MRHEALALLTRLADNAEVRAVLPCMERIVMDLLVNEYEAEEAAHDAHLEAMADANDMRAEMAAAGCREWDNASHA